MISHIEKLPEVGTELWMLCQEKLDKLIHKPQIEIIMVKFIRIIFGVGVTLILFMISLLTLIDGEVIIAIVSGLLSFGFYKFYFRERKNNKQNNRTPSNQTANNISGSYISVIFECRDCGQRSRSKNANPKYNTAICGTCGSTNTFFYNYICTCLTPNNKIGPCRNCGKNHF